MPPSRDGELLMRKREQMKRKLVRRRMSGGIECELLGRHFFVRDRLLGIPLGRPYCMWCGAEKKR